MRYETVDVYEFGRRLIDEDDLDPLYSMIHESRLTPADKAKYILSYWCFYDTGTAACLTDSKSYWGEMGRAASTAIYPRGGDRRHYRGQAAIDSVKQINGLGKSAFDLLNYLSLNGELTYLGDTMGRIMEMRGFGPTISFKAADMLERLWGARYEFKETDPLLMSKPPREGAGILAGRYQYKGGSNPIWAHRKLIERLSGMKIPPLYEREITVLETETILCKWGHHLKGIYPIGRGKEAQRLGLEKYPRSPVGKEMMAAGRRIGLWK